MRSESTSALGQPSETMPTLGAGGNVVAMIAAAHRDLLGKCHAGVDRGSEAAGMEGNYVFVIPG